MALAHCEGDKQRGKIKDSSLLVGQGLFRRKLRVVPGTETIRISSPRDHKVFNRVLSIKGAGKGKVRMG